MCRETGVSRAGFYRHWHQREPSVEETELRERLQQLALAQRSYGYRRIAALLRREGRLVNHKSVLRLLREDNGCILCLGRGGGGRKASGKKCCPRGG